MKSVAIVHRWIYSMITVLATVGATFRFLDWNRENYPEGLAGFFPGILLLFIVFVTAVLARSGTDDSSRSSTVSSVGNTANLFVAIGLLAVFTISTYFVGFPIALLLFQIAVLRTIFCWRGPRSVAVPMLATVAVTFVFSKLLIVALPRGIGWFFDLNSVLI